MRRTKGNRPKPIGGRSQRVVLRDVMLSAAECGTWLTLRELSRLTSYGEASISAQLRHLRKPRCGAFVIGKQVRKYDEANHVAEHGAVWEYRLGCLLRAQTHFLGVSEKTWVNWTEETRPSRRPGATAARHVAAAEIFRFSCLADVPWFPDGDQ
jgi:hypothetical protein